MKYFDQEDPNFHYPVDLIDVEGKVVLDLGCGNEGNLNIMPFPSTPEHFLNNGAKKVIGVELHPADLDYLSNKIDASKGTFLAPSKSVQELIREYGVEVIKCDNEGGERELFDLPAEVFGLVEEYYIETHNGDLNQDAKRKLEQCGYDIKEELEFAPLNGLIRVIFARRR